MRHVGGRGGRKGIKRKLSAMNVLILLGTGQVGIKAISVFHEDYKTPPNKSVPSH
jgi:hypothetical protein